MKYIVITFLLLTPLIGAAQTITLGPITKLTYCVGDTIVVPYQASGTFAGDNTFVLQMSDVNGSFTTFTNLGHATRNTDSITVKLNNTGGHYRIRIASTDPYILSSDNGADISVVGYPSPQPWPADGSYHGFAGDSIQLSDRSSESTASTFLWKLDQDANPNTSTDPSPKILYLTPGVKSGTLTVANSSGCSTSVFFQFNLIGCMPTIPANAHIVTGTETGSDVSVWVKAGGSYTTSNESNTQTIYAEPGSSVRAEFRTLGLYYMKAGSSFISSNGQGYAAVVLNRGTSISWDSYNSVDTFYCDNLNFDYSLVSNGSVNDVTLPLLFLHQTADYFSAFAEGEIIDVRLTNLLGTEVLSSQGVGELDVDLAPLRAGVYFAVVEAGQQREVRRIAVVH
jgi:hypothetical protein